MSVKDRINSKRYASMANEDPEPLSTDEFFKILEEFKIEPGRFWDFFEYNRNIRPTDAHQAKLDFMANATRGSLVDIIEEYSAHVDRMSHTPPQEDNMADES